MHKGLAAALIMTALALAGCSGGKEGARFQDVACPGGVTLTADDIEAAEGSGADGFDPATLCPVPPAVLLTGVPATVQVYGEAPFSWAIDPGSVNRGHSMITEIRYSDKPIPDGEASITTYSKSVIKKEHQDLPVTFKGNMTFTTVGKVYVRAYAAVQGENPNGTKFDRRDVWGPEIVLDVLPVQPTGTLATITHALGPLDPLEGPTSANLGDAVSFDNQDLVEHTLTLGARPSGVADCVLTASGGPSADTCLLTAPGSYTFETDDVDPKTFLLSVQA